MSDEKNETTETETVSEQPEITKEEKKALFLKYEEMASRVERLDAELVEARRVLSEHIRTICTTLASNGPFSFNGKQLVASHKRDTWFFKSHKVTAEVID